MEGIMADDTAGVSVSFLERYGDFFILKFFDAAARAAHQEFAGKNEAQRRQYIGKAVDAAFRLAETGNDEEKLYALDELHNIFDHLAGSVTDEQRERLKRLLAEKK
jgi:hypothetical protein